MAHTKNAESAKKGTSPGTPQFFSFSALQRLRVTRNVFLGRDSEPSRIQIYMISAQKRPRTDRNIGVKIPGSDLPIGIGSTTATGLLAKH